MRKVPLDPLTTLPLQTLAAISLNSPPVAIHSLLLNRSTIPVANPAIGFSNVTPHFQFSQFDEHLVAVITLVGHHLLEALRMHFARAFRWLHIDQLGYRHARLNHRFRHRRRVGGGSAVRGD